MLGRWVNLIQIHGMIQIHVFTKRIHWILLRSKSDKSDKPQMIASYFKFEERSTNLAQEIRAGASCFLTMSYILLVNPQVLSAIGIPTTDIGKCN